MGENGDDKYYYNNFNYNMAHNQLDSHVNMATVALVTGLIAIPLSFVMNIGVVLGGVAVVLAILSRGSQKKFLPQAKRGMIYGTIGIVLGYVVFVSSLHTVLTDPAYRQQLNQMSEQMNGQTFDELLQELGIDPGQ